MLIAKSRRHTRGIFRGLRLFHQANAKQLAAVHDGRQLLDNSLRLVFLFRLWQAAYGRAGLSGEQAKRSSGEQRQIEPEAQWAVRGERKKAQGARLCGQHIAEQA